MEFGFRAAILYLDVGDVDVPIVYQVYYTSIRKRKEMVLSFPHGSIDLDWKICKLKQFVSCGDM